MSHTLKRAILEPKYFYFATHFLKECALVYYLLDY